MNFKCEVVRLGKIGKHPNADSLSITEVFGTPCIFRTGDFAEGDLVGYIPLDAMVPTTDPRFAFLDKKCNGQPARLKAVKLRGIYSEGILIKAEPDWSEGQDITPLLGITKYVEFEPSEPGVQTPAPKTVCQVPYYDVESWRKYKHLLTPGADVFITEKIHGANSRFVTTEDGVFHAGSHGTWKRFNPDAQSDWWKIAIQYDLQEKLKPYPGLVLYGEIYGKVQDLRYGATNENPLMFRAFDVYDSNHGKWFDPEDFLMLMVKLQIPVVPILYAGPYTPEKVLELAAGQSTLDSGTIREGVVVKPALGRWNHACGRVILKMISEAYHLRKNGTERK
jgi:RNA ligase (TIGR02306 family)